MSGRRFSFCSFSCKDIAPVTKIVWRLFICIFSLFNHICVQCTVYLVLLVLYIALIRPKMDSIFFFRIVFRENCLTMKSKDAKFILHNNIMYNIYNIHIYVYWSKVITLKIYHNNCNYSLFRISITSWHAIL